MKLKRLKLENFRSYKYLSIDFDDNMNVIIGRNDVGKSTVMEALEIFFNNDLVKIQQDDLNIYAKREDKYEIKISLSFKIESTDTIIIDSTYPTNLKDEYLLNNDGLLTLIKEWDCSKPIKATSLKYYLECEYPTILSDKPLLSLKNTDLKKQIRELKEILDADIYNSIPQNANAPMRKALYEYLLTEDDRNNRTSILIDLSKGDDVKGLKVNIDQVLPLFFLFQSDRPNRDSDKDVQNPLNIAISKALVQEEIHEKLKDVERLMKEQIKDVADKTLEKLNEMDPNVASTLKPDYTKEPDWKSVFKFSFTGDDIPLNKRGSGVRRLVLLNYFRAEAERRVDDRFNKSVIYAIEEPETSQHPDYQKMLIEALLELSNEAHHQVVITTHTPNIVKMVNIENVIPLIRDEKTNEIIDFNDDEILITSILSTLGILPNIDIENVSEVKCIVCVEGKWDVEFLQNINKSVSEFQDIIILEDNNKVLIIPMGGSTIEYWANKNLLKKLQINQVHIYDSDIGSSNPNKYSKYFGSINNQGLNNFTFETKKREMENYIHSSIIETIYSDFNLSYDENWDALDVVEETAKLTHNNSESEKSWDELEPEKKKKKLGFVKKCFNNELSKAVRKYHLEELESFEEIKEWFNKMKEAVETNSKFNH